MTETWTAEQIIRGSGGYSDEYYAQRTSLMSKLENWQSPESDRIPAYMHDSIVAYIMEGVRPGDFLTAVLQNDLCAAVNRADADNHRALRSWATFLYNEIPSQAWGSEQNFESWIASHNKSASERLKCLELEEEAS